MEITINYWAVIVGAILLMVSGALWYGPLFGKKWMKIIGAEHMGPEEMEKSQKEIVPLYILQFILSLITSLVLYYIIKLSNLGLALPFFIWLGFIMPQAAGAMWDTKKGLRMSKFLIVAGYQFLTLFILGYLFIMW